MKGAIRVIDGNRKNSGRRCRFGLVEPGPCKAAIVLDAFNDLVNQWRSLIAGCKFVPELVRGLRQKLRQFEEAAAHLRCRQFGALRKTSSAAEKYPRTCNVRRSSLPSWPPNPGRPRCTARHRAARASCLRRHKPASSSWRAHHCSPTSVFNRASRLRRVRELPALSPSAPARSNRSRRGRPRSGICTPAPHRAPDRNPLDADGAANHAHVVFDHNAPRANTAALERLGCPPQRH